MSKKQKIFLVIAILILCSVFFVFRFVIFQRLGIGNQLTQIQNFSVKDSSFNYKTTKLATIPFQYPKRGHCEGFEALSDISCWITSFGEPSFNSTGRIVTYKLIEPHSVNQKIVISDGISSYIINNIDELQLDPDDTNPSNHTTDIIKNGTQYFAVVDDKKYGPYDAITELSTGGYFALSKDGKHVMWLAYDQSGASVIIDGVSQGKHRYIEDPILLDDGTPAYVGNEIGTGPLGNNFFVGKSIKINDLWNFKIDFKNLIVTDSNRDYLIWLSKSRHNMGSAIYLSDNKNHYLNTVGDYDLPIATYIDGKKFSDYLATSVAFSPDSNKVAFVDGGNYLGGGANSIVIMDLQSGSFTRKILETKGTILFGLQFTPDSSKLIQVYANYIVVGDQKGHEYDNISNLPHYNNKPTNTIKFSPNGQYMAYGARKDHELWWIATKLK